ncbi:MAG: hypothetical protein HZB53_15935 [Chloroflexi bacterium]|nr:hypothetical protein [Chloroflexota bacterium]
MNGENIFPLAFLGVFELIGGAAFGYGLRTMIKDRDPGQLFLLIWGGGFGGIPMVISLFLGLASPTPTLALVGPAVFFGMMLFSLLLAQPMTRYFGAGPTFGMLAGGLLMLAGAATAVAQYNRANVIISVALGGAIFLVGSAIMARSANAALGANDK